MLTARWSIATHPRTHGAIAAVAIASHQLENDLRELALPNIEPGSWRTADLLGVDRGVIARWTPARCELMPHGGPLILRRLTQALTDLGCAHDPQPHPFEMYPEAADPLEARMLAALARARSAAAIDLLLDQPRRWAEARLDPENPPPTDQQLADAAALRHLIRPPLVAAIGPPNTGKSTLLNALAMRTRAVVADQPGTTRDHVGVELDLEGLSVRYLDTPGLLARPAGPDAPAIEAALAAARAADLILACGDPTRPPPDTAALGLAAPTIRVCLRADLGEPRWPAEAAVVAPDRRGLPELIGRVRDALVPRHAIDDPRPWLFWGASHRTDGPDRAPSH